MDRDEKRGKKVRMIGIGKRGKRSINASEGTVRWKWQRMEEKRERNGNRMGTFIILSFLSLPIIHNMNKPVSPLLVLLSIQCDK